jgi:hypothetical protein
VLVTAWFAATAGGASTLQKAGSIAAIVGASVALTLFLAALVRWWWRNHRVRSVKVRVFTSGEEGFYVGVKGLPAASAEVTTLVNDGTRTKRSGPHELKPWEPASETTFSLVDKTGLDKTVETYTVTVFVTLIAGEQRRVFKQKVKRSRFEDS